VNSTTGLEFSLVPGGTFLMGPLSGDPRCSLHDTPQHVVTLTRPFLICRTKVTCGAWARIHSSMPNSDIFPSGPSEYFGDVPWEIADEWCRAAGLELPTEAQWEWAARGGTRGACFYEAHYHGHHGVRPRDSSPLPAGILPDSGNARLSPNAFGLHNAVNMVTDLAEWTSDGCYDYNDQPAVDPIHETGPSRNFRNPQWVGMTGGPFPVWARGCKSWETVYHNTIGLRPIHNISVGPADHSTRRSPR
jgi:formylglycine-generating enzyme required for sulfatase activity